VIAAFRRTVPPIADFDSSDPGDIAYADFGH
jgi:hypothetical protein